MLKHLAHITFTLLIASPLVYAEDDTNPACAMVVCLSASGGGTACQTAKDDFFDIVVKKHGEIKIDRTIKKRHDKLDSCEGSQASDTARIIARYGAIIK